MLELVLLVSQSLVGFGVIRGKMNGSPLGILEQVLRSFGNGEVWPHLRVTLHEQVAGYISGVSVGTAAAWALWWTPLLGRALEPFVAIFNGIPKIALAPPMIV